MSMMGFTDLIWKKLVTLAYIFREVDRNVMVAAFSISRTGNTLKFYGGADLQMNPLTAKSLMFGWFLFSQIFLSS